MESEVLSRLQSFSLSSKETEGVEILECDVSIGLEEGHRSLIGKLFGDKKANFVGIKGAMMKLWQSKGLCKIVALDQNVYQFIFGKAEDREPILRGRPWLFDNFLLVLHPWTEHLCLDDPCFTISPFWVQVWHVPHHWFSLDTGRKIGKSLGSVKDVMIMESGGKEARYINVLVDIDLTQPLLRGIKLKYKTTEVWVEFQYEQLPIFCFYCGLIGHHERMCLKRKKDSDQDCLLSGQFGGWLRANHRKTDGWGNRGNKAGIRNEEFQSQTIIGTVQANVPPTASQLPRQGPVDQLAGQQGNIGPILGADPLPGHQENIQDDTLLLKH